ncbi:MAG: hypothetical protein GX556_08885 [Fibrobacter sp.]|nr:hypothetical protein [Fibrobacter sp.]
MKLRLSIYPVLLLLMCSLMSYSQTVKRGRNEGTFNISPSNVAGNGNITTGISLSGGYGETGLRADPGFNVAIGISDIMQLSGRASFTNFQGLGAVECRLQITTPENNNLRFFGMCINGDLYLSTTKDTLIGSATETRPDYNPFFRPSAVIDLDWIALSSHFPLKNYFSFSMSDNPDMLYLYNQLSFKTGFEWKLYQNSIILDAGLGLYKEKPNLMLPSGDKGFKQQTFWIEPGIRYRLFQRISLLGSLRTLIFQRVKHDRPLPANYMRLSCAVEVPLIYRETNSEAIRTMIFVEKEREKKKDFVTKNIEQQKSIRPDFELTFDEFKTDLPDAAQQREQLQKREEIHEKMQEIESLLEDLE